MNIIIAGGSGFVGRHLVTKLREQYQITVIGRDKINLKNQFSPTIKTLTWDMLPTIDASSYDLVINLCGFNISASRWNHEVKKKIIDSRVKTNTRLLEWLIEQKASPRYFCANAVGIYGLQEHGALEAFDEESPIDFVNPRDFMSEIGIRWQESLEPALQHGIPVTTLRFGVVLAKGEGMLKKLVSSFYVGLGSILGDGQQTLSWVHIDDVVGAILFLISHPELTGAFNITSPNPTSQETFARTLAKCMHRPLFLKMPAFVVRLLFGEMGECLLLKGQRVIPKRLINSGYTFSYPLLNDAFSQIFKA
jgi:uncharacterized protein